MSAPFLQIDGHVHSEHSPDSENKIKEILQKAKSRRIKTVAVIDHCYIPRHVLALESRIRQSIKGGPKLILGTEISIEMKFGLEILMLRDKFEWDIVAGAVHDFPDYDLYPQFGPDNRPLAAFGQCCRKVGIKKLVRMYVNRSIEAMQSGYLDILVHPLDLFCYAGILLPELFLDAADELVMSASQSSTLIELNNHTLSPKSFPVDCRELEQQRFRIYKFIIDRCVRSGVRLVSGSDAHQLDSVGEMSNIFDFCKKANVPEDLFVSRLPFKN